MKSIFKKIFLVFLILMTILNTFISVYMIILWNNVKFDDLSKLYPIGNTTIYDKNGNLLANLSNIYTDYAPYESIPEVLINAFISIEDSRFFSHHGLDYEAIARSIVANIKDQEFSQGASTITQQLIKNVYLSNEKTIERKINEAILSLKLEHILSKEDILSSYLSNVLFGGRIYGVKMASKYYFNKELADITLKEASMLAGLVQMPNYYNPFTNYEAAQDRRNLVLKAMLNEAYIDEETYENTINIELSSYLNKGQINENIGIYASYIDYVSYEAITKYNIDFYSSDLKIEINVDSNIQKMIYQIMNNNYNHFKDEYLKCGIVVLDPKTAEILAISGTREAGMRNLNYATEVLHQPASTIKPILSYAPAIEYLNFQPQTQILDEPYRYQNGMLVNNWDNRYLGNISLRYALANSRNVPAIKLYNEVGSKLAWEFASSVGLDNRDNYSYEAMAIGGFSKGFTVLEMANAYLTFPNMGKYKKASSINNIKTNNTLFKNEDKFHQVLSEETAFLINDILHDVLKYTNYDLKNTFLSSKTGQSNYDYNTRMKYNIPANATKDSWVIGYTPDLLVAVWCGYEDIKKGLYLTPKTKDIPLDIVKMILDEFAPDSKGYKIPNNLKRMNVEVINGLIYHANNNKNSVSDYFFKGYTPLNRDNLDLDIV